METERRQDVDLTSGTPAGDHFVEKTRRRDFIARFRWALGRAE